MSKASKQKRDAKKKLAKKSNAAFVANRAADCCTPSGCSASEDGPYVNGNPFGTNV